MHSSRRADAGGFLHPRRAAHATRYHVTSSSPPKEAPPPRVDGRCRASSPASRADSRFLSASADASSTMLDNAGALSGGGLAASRDSWFCCPDDMGGNTSESTTSDTDVEANLVFLPPRFGDLLLTPPPLRASPCAATVEMKRSPLSRKAFRTVDDKRYKGVVSQPHCHFNELKHVACDTTMGVNAGAKNKR